MKGDSKTRGFVAGHGTVPVAPPEAFATLSPHDVERFVEAADGLSTVDCLRDLVEQCIKRFELCGQPFIAQDIKRQYERV